MRSGERELRGPLEGLSIATGRSRRNALNHEEVLAVLTDSREEAKSIKEIAQAMGSGDLLLCGLGEGRAAVGQGLGSYD